MRRFSTGVRPNVKKIMKKTYYPRKEKARIFPIAKKAVAYAVYKKLSSLLEKMSVQ